MFIVRIGVRGLPGADHLVERFREAVRMGADLVSSDRPDLLVPFVAPLSH